MHTIMRHDPVKMFFFKLLEYFANSSDKDQIAQKVQSGLRSTLYTEEIFIPKIL